MLQYKKVIGKIHPAFFTCSKLFNRFDIENKDGDVGMHSPFFDLSYQYYTGSLSCDDSEVLHDFVGLIQSNYGCKLTRHDAVNMYDLTDVNRDWSILNFAVCILEDSVAGWDGSVNSVFFDLEAPGEVVNIVHQVWNKQMLLDSWKLEKQDIEGLGFSLALPNLADALVILDSKRRSKVEKLIKSVI